MSAPETMGPEAWAVLTIEQKRQQVADQYRVVAHLAKVMAGVHDQLASVIESGAGAIDSILDIQGERSAMIMEYLGDTLNAMDAVDETDAWTGPVFAEAQRLFPSCPI
jgi:hypothetical protein